MQTLVSRPGRGYWIVAGLALVWMLIGVSVWAADLLMDEAALAQLSEAQRQVYLSRPQWLFVVYALAVFSGLAGAIGLLVRKAWASWALAVSLCAVTVQFGYTLWFMDTIRLLGPDAALPGPAVILAIGAFLFWFSTKARRTGRLS